MDDLYTGIGPGAGTPIRLAVDPMLAAAVMASRTPMVVSDPALPDNPMVLVNAAFCRMTGYEAHALQGRNCRLLQGPKTDPAAVDALRQAVAQRRETTVELLNYRRNGDSFWSEVFISPIFWPDGTLRYFIASQHDSTERRLAELHRDPRLARQANGQIASWRWEPQTKLLSWSEASTPLFGTSLPQHAGLAGWVELIHPDDRAATVRAVSSIAALGQLTFEYRILRLGETRWIEAAGSVVMRDGAGTATLVTGIATDVTQRRAAERALQAREARTRLALDAARAGAWELDTVTGRAITSPRHDEIMGHSQIRGAWTAEMFQAAVVPADRAAAQAQMQEAFAARAPLHLLTRIAVNGTEQPRWIEAWGCSAGPDSASYYGIVADVTDRKLAEDALAKTEAGFRLALDAARLGRWDHDLAAGRWFYDPRMLEIFGAPHQPLAAEDNRDAMLDRVLPDDRLLLEQATAEAQNPSGGGSFHVEFRLAPLQDARPRWVRATGQVTFQGGVATRFLGVCEDVTDDKISALALLDLNQTLEAEVAARTAERDRTWRLSQELLAVTVAGQGIVSVNPSWERVLGWLPGQLLGRSLMDLVHPEDLAATLAETRRAEAGAVSLQFRNRCRTTTGDWRAISWTTVPEGATFYLSGRDVTKIVEAADALEQAEAQLRQMQKMEAVGQLTGGIAHDFNNMLSVVIGGLTLVQRRLAKGDTDVGSFIESALDGARRAGALTQRLLAFSRQQPLQPRALDLGRLVREMTELLHRTLGETIQLDVTAPAGLWRVNVDHSQMENVILNLAVNGRDAMPDGGRLTIACQNAPLHAAAAGDLGLPPGDYARVAVADCGTGMPEAVLARAFEPFFTTKGVGAGTGLGLSQVYGFARQSGGHARITSRTGAGTTVEIWLPRMEEDSPADEQAAEPQPDALPTGRGQTVLLVEDEERVRQFSTAALRELGYKVIESPSAAEALAALDANEDIALLFTDVVMPEVNGRVLANEALRRRPGLRVLFTTGYARDAMDNDGIVDPATNLLTKPFTLAQLAAKLHEIL